MKNSVKLKQMLIIPTLVMPTLKKTTFLEFLLFFWYLQIHF